MPYDARMSAPAGWDSDVMTMTGGVHSQVREVEVEDFAYAGWFRRLLGRVIDGILWAGALIVAYAGIGIVALAVVLAFRPSYWDTVWDWSPSDVDTGNLSNVALILSLIIGAVALGVFIAVWWFYFPAAMSTKGGTVGMRLLGTKIVSTDGHHNVRLGQVVARFFFEWLLGAIFLYFQVYEYMHAYQDLGLTLGSGIYGSTFFMLTGFHGLHVTLGAIMLFVIMIRCIRGHFRPESHFGFEAVAWYWHFVDVVWLGLFLFVYVY